MDDIALNSAYTNEDRAEWAGKGVFVYRAVTGTDEESVLADLLCDLRHWADKNGQDWDEALARGDFHYESEVLEEC
jgi:hypothetical protein